MKIRSSFSQALSNPFVDALLAAKTAEALMPLLRGGDDSQQFLNASLASGTPATSIPRHGLSGLIAKTGLISPDEQASPDVMNQEKIALSEQALGTRKAEADIAEKRASAGKQNPFEVWRAQNPGASVGDYFKLSQKPGQETPYKDWREANPSAPMSEWFKLAHSADKSQSGEGTYTAISPDQITLGPDHKTHGVNRINNKTNRSEFVPVDAPLGAKAEKGNAMVDSLNDAMATLDDLENSLSVLPEKSGTGSGVAAKASLSYGRLISSDTNVASFDSARSRIIEVANTLRKGNRLNLTEYNAIKAGLPGDHDSQESAGVKIDKERAFLQKILAREKSRGGTATDLGATGITGGDPIAVGHSAASDFLGSP